MPGNAWSRAYYRRLFGAGRTDLTLGNLALSSLGTKAGAGEMTVDLTGTPSLAQLDFEIAAGALLMDLTADWTED